MAYLDMCPIEYDCEHMKIHDTVDVETTATKGTTTTKVTTTNETVEISVKLKETQDLQVGFRRPSRNWTSRTAATVVAPSTTASTIVTKTTASNKTVTFKFNDKKMLENTEKSTTLSSLFPVTWIPGMKEYVIISDEESESDSEEATTATKGKGVDAVESSFNYNSGESSIGRDNVNDAVVFKCSSSSSDDDDDDDEEIECATSGIEVKSDRSLKEKFSVWTKDIGNLFTGPSQNLREFLRKREGYVPPNRSLTAAKKKSETGFKK